MKRDMWTETRKSKRIGKMLLVFIDTGVGGIVPNHAPRERKVMLSRSKYGWHLHLAVKTLRTWNGYRSFDFNASFHPSKHRREHLQGRYEQHGGRSWAR